MTSIYRVEDDEYDGRRARRSKAGSFRPPRNGAHNSTRRTYAPQAIVKVAGWANAPSSVKRMLDYIARIEDKEKREQVSLESEDGIQRLGKAEVDEIFDEWKDDFNRKKQRAKSSRHAVHIVLSAKADLTGENVDKTLKAARRTVEEHFGDKGYKYALGVHQDGKSPHVHAVVKAVSPHKGTPKLRLNPRDLLEVRRSFAAELTREGLEHVASREPKRRRVRHSRIKGNKPNTLAKVQAVLKNMDKELRQFERKMGRKEPTVNAFKFRRQQGKTLETLRSQVKEDKTLIGQDRKEAFNLIRSFRRDIERKGIKPEAEINATVKHFDDCYAKWENQASRDKLLKLNTDDQNRKRLQQTIEEGKKLRHGIEQFLRNDLKVQNVRIEKKKAVFKQLRSKSLEIGRFRELYRGR